MKPFWNLHDKFGPDTQSPDHQFFTCVFCCIYLTLNIKWFMSVINWFNTNSRFFGANVDSVVPDQLVYLSSLIRAFTVHLQNFQLLCEPHQTKIYLHVVCGQQRPRSDCTCVQSDQGLHCLQTKLDTTECFNGEQMSE